MAQPSKPVSISRVLGNLFGIPSSEEENRIQVKAYGGDNIAAALEKLLMISRDEQPHITVYTTKGEMVRSLQILPAACEVSRNGRKVLVIARQGNNPRPYKFTWIAEGDDIPSAENVIGKLEVAWPTSAL